MNLPYFISRRISKNEAGSFSTTINKIAVVSIAVALASLILAFTILRGFEDTIKEKIYSFSGHLIISKYTLSSSFEESSIALSDSLLNLVENNERVDYVQAYAYKAGLLKTGEEVQGVIVKGLDHRFDTAAFSVHLKKGTFPVFPHEGYGTEVAISARVADYLKLDVGDEVMIFFVQNPPRYRKLKITGIYETGLEEFDEKVVLGDINMIRRINGWDENQAGGLEVYLKDPGEMEAAEEQLFDEVGYDLYVDKVSDKYIQIFDWLRLLNRNVVIFLVLILFVACFNMVSILLILILERTQMVGTFKALGSGNKLLRKIFLFNGLRLIVRGLTWGNLIALAICWLQRQFQLIPLDPANYYMDHVPVSFDAGIVIILNLMAILIVGLTLLIPLAVISRISPIRAIRFD